MLETMPWLSWLVPPLLGALIGYVTNYIAIRMLFRPLQPLRRESSRSKSRPAGLSALCGSWAPRG